MNRHILFTSLVAVGALVATQLMAQPPGRGPGGRGGRPNPMGIGGLLMSEQVRGEIELLEEQEQELRELGDEMRGRMRELFGGMRDLPPEERRAAIQDARADMDLIREEVEGRVKEVLMPEQFERLRQIELQQQMRRGGGAAVANGRVAEELGLSDEQREEMQRKAEEAQKTLEEKIQKLRQEAREEVLSVLTSEQRAKLDSMVGKPFEIERPDFGRGRGGRRGPGRGEGPPRRGESPPSI